MENKSSNMNNKIKPVILSSIDIKNRIEDSISHSNDRYADTKILFENKDNIFVKLPYSDFKIAIAQEIEEDKLLLSQINQYQLIEENVEIEKEEAEVKEPQEDEVNVIDEIYEFEQDVVKKPKYRSKIVKTDTAAIIAKIKAEAREKNKGKKVTSFRDINKELRPYMIKKMHGVETIDKDAMTSIDIYLNAVNKIDVVTSLDDIKDPDATNKPVLEDILDDLNK